MKKKSEKKKKMLKNSVTNDEIEEEKVRSETKIACLRPRPRQPPKGRKQKRNAAEGRKEGIRKIERWKERRTESGRRLEVGEGCVELEIDVPRPLLATTGGEVCVCVCV